jgi:hypothetical protein
MIQEYSYGNGQSRQILPQFEAPKMIESVPLHLPDNFEIESIFKPPNHSTAKNSLLSPCLKNTFLKFPSGATSAKKNLKLDGMVPPCQRGHTFRFVISYFRVD